MKHTLERGLLTVTAVLLAFSLFRFTAPPVAAQAGAQYKVVMFDPKNYVDQSERLAEACNAETRAGWSFVSMGTVVSTTYLVFRR